MKIWYLPNSLQWCRYGNSAKVNIDDEIEYYRYEIMTFRPIACNAL